MATFKEGQEVEVWGANMYPWRKAKVIGWTACRNQSPRYEVEFPDGMRTMFDAANIRAVEYDGDAALAARANILGTDF